MTNCADVSTNNTNIPYDWSKSINTDGHVIYVVRVMQKLSNNLPQSLDEIISKLITIDRSDYVTDETARTNRIVSNFDSRYLTTHRSISIRFRSISRLSVPTVRIAEVTSATDIRCISPKAHWQRQTCFM